MFKLEQISQEILPMDKFGQYLRDHIVDRGHQYTRQMVLRAVRHFAEDIPEHDVHQWVEKQFELQKGEWENHELPRVKKDLESSAQWYVEQHAKEYGHVDEPNPEDIAEIDRPWEDCDHEYVDDISMGKDIKICIHCGDVL